MRPRPACRTQGLPPGNSSRAYLLLQIGMMTGTRLPQRRPARERAAPCPTEKRASGRSAVGRGRYGRSTCGSGGEQRGLAVEGVDRVEGRPGGEERFATDRSPDVDGARGHDDDDRVVEVVVIPVPGEPRGIGGVRIRNRREPDEGRNEDRDDGPA